MKELIAYFTCALSAFGVAAWMIWDTVHTGYWEMLIIPIAMLVPVGVLAAVRTWEAYDNLQRRDN